MQDYGRTLIVGEQTFGKGTVQQHRGLGRIYDFYDNPPGSVQFIAKFYRIDGVVLNIEVLFQILFSHLILMLKNGEKARGQCATLGQHKTCKIYNLW